MFAKPSGIPRQSGCYLFKNAADTVIYVGKALLAQPATLELLPEVRRADARRPRHSWTRPSLGRVDRHAQRDRRADPRERADQAEPAALQHASQGRQELSPTSPSTRAASSPSPTSPERSISAACATSGPSSTCAPCATRWTNSADLPAALVHHAQVRLPPATRVARVCSSTSTSVRVPAWGPSTPRATPNWWRRGRDSSTATCESFARCSRARWRDAAATAALRGRGQGARRSRRPRTRRQRSEHRARRPLEPRRDRHRHPGRSRRAGALSRAPRTHHRPHRAPHRPLDGRGRRRDLRGRPARALRRPRARSPPVVVTNADSRRVRRSPHEFLDANVARRPVEIVAPQRGRRRRVLDLALHDAIAVIDRDSLRRQSDHNVRSRALQELGAAHSGSTSRPFASSAST